MYESVVLAGLILQVLTLVTLGFFLLQLSTQQGRILLRLDSLEGKRAQPEDEMAASGPKGLEIGTAVADVELPDLTGKTRSLSEFRGRRLLLIYWSPDCGFCDMSAPELVQMQSALEENHTQLVLVSYGNAEANQKLAAEHGLNCTILLLKDSTAEKYLSEEVFKYCGTPSAYLLDEQGQVAQPLAAGMTAVVALARKAADGAQPKKAAVRKLPLSESRIEREGLGAGTPAPAFNLPDIHGQPVALEQFRGQRVLLVFTDPQCGPCDELAPHLVRLHREHTNNGLSLIMVGRGDQLENRRKAAQHGVQFPVVIQPKWKLAKEDGTFATPAAFLIGEDGVISSPPAMGKDAILALAGLAQGLHSEPLAPGFVVGPSPVTGPRGAKER